MAAVRRSLLQSVSSSAFSMGSREGRGGVGGEKGRRKVPHPDLREESGGSRASSSPALPTHGGMLSCNDNGRDGRAGRGARCAPFQPWK